MANFGEEESGLEAVGRMYSSGELLVDTSFSGEGDDASLGHVDIREMRLRPGHAFVIKLPK